jgi:hypothetical protein
MITSNDIKRVQTALGSQQAGNNVVGTTMFKGGFACGSSGQVLAAATGPFVVVPDSGGTPGTYRAYPQVNGQILSIDNAVVTGFTPRNPSASETTIAQVTGYNIDSANNQWYITIQLATFSGALQGSLPAKFVVGVQCSVTLSSTSNPL